LNEKCSCCGLKFKRGIILSVTSYEDYQTLIRKRWKKRSVPMKIYICDKCKNVAFALVRNNVAIKTSDIIDD
jgi:hypothetical protein